MSSAVEPCCPEPPPAATVGPPASDAPPAVAPGAARAEKPIAAPGSKASDPKATATAGQILRLACWLGLAVGLAEAAYVAISRFALGEFTFEGDRLFWICPAVQAATFLVLALPFAAVAIGARRPPALGPVIGWMAFAGTLNMVLLIPGLHMGARLLVAGGIAAQVWRLAATRGPGIHRFVRRTLVYPVLLVLVIAGVVEGGRWGRPWRAMAGLPPPRAGAPNVLLIVLDTVRYDALTLDEAQSPHELTAETPNLRRLAAGGVAFDRATAPAPWTLPSHATMFTGRHPHEHGAGWHRALDNTYPTLAERLAKQGYVTGGFVGNTWYCSAETGLSRGFARYDDYGMTVDRFLRSTALGRHVLSMEWLWHHHDIVDRKHAEDVSGAFLGWLDRTREDHPQRPFFAFLNYFDAHDPYVAPPGFARLPPETDAEWYFMLQYWAAKKQDLTDRELDLCKTGYVDSISYLDHHLGRLLEELGRRGLLDNTLIVVTSDHGEHFGDHELYGHGNSLYQAVLHVPLIFRLPGRIPEGCRVEAAVGLDELPTTVLDLIGGRRDGDGQDAEPGIGPPFPGRSLRRFWEDRVAGAEDPQFPRLAEIAAPSPVPPCNGRSPTFRGPMKAILAGRFKYIRTGDDEELYDVLDDPGEIRDLSTVPPYGATLDQLRASLDRLIEGPGH